ncbi:thiolase family protein [Brucella gallinifaecis]|uniref:Thiolase family protein n=1 Tax=Brucella gallinifaecis TaxID=215590 RepID=A0A502BKC1_9HYPH|nr:thiolase family protein [Brucella gallinifaecis]TPF74277.1 thiolase family protein [Brucella gallinifaecis]
MSGVFITAMTRTPFGRFKGKLAGIDVVDLGAALLNELTKRDPQATLPDTVIGGSGLMGGVHLTALRQMLIGSDLPNRTVSIAVDRACCTGMTAISAAFAQLKTGGGDKAYIAGVESLSNTPLLISRGNERKIASMALTDPLLLGGRVSPKTIAQYTSEEALHYGITREMQDDWAFASHQKYFVGKGLGLYDDLVFSPPEPGLSDTADEGPRANSDRQKLANLPTVNGSETITAGNAPGLSDGAAGLVLMTGDAMKATGATAIAEVVDRVQVAGDIQEGTSVPQVAMMRLLARNSLNIDDISVVEINEAFAATPLVSTALMAKALHTDLDALRAKTNIYGGAVAIGHPLAASGIRIVQQSANILRHRGGGLALCAICGGFGQGEAVLIRV